MRCGCGKPVYYSGGCTGEWEHEGECNSKSPELEVEESIRLGKAAYLRSENKDLLEENARLRKALERVATHGCCVMHDDRGCPGCAAKDALRELDGDESVMTKLPKEIVKRLIED